MLTPTRKTLREAFVREVRDELADIGWALISGKRVNQEIAQARAGVLDENDLRGLLEDDDLQEADEGE